MTAAPPAADPGRGDRIPELDALRGFAALGVLALHTLHDAFFWAWSCVDLFFILSGFLITSILLRNADAPGLFFAFYVRRALRIWPVYYLTWAATTLFCVVATWALPPATQWLALAFVQYTDRYLPGAGELGDLWYFGHSWSLAVEEQFYLLWPLLLLLLKPPRALLAAGLLAGLVGAAVARHQGMFIYLLATRVDGLLFGILLAFAARGRWLYRVPPALLLLAGLLGLALLLPYLASAGGANLWGESPRRALEVTAFCLVYAAVVAAAVRWSGHPLLAPLRHRALVHIGRLSFALYMYQVPLAYLLFEAQRHGWVPQSLVKPLLWPLTFAAAQLSYLFLERRMLALKDRFPYARGGAARTTSAAAPKLAPEA